MEPKSDQTGNPNLTLGEGSGGGGGRGAEDYSGKYSKPFLDRVARIFDNYNYQEDLDLKNHTDPEEIEFRLLYRVLDSFVRECKMKKAWKELVGAHDALKNSHEQLQRASDADKEKIRDLEKNLEHLGALSNDADKQKIMDLEKNLEDLGAQFKVLQKTAEENVMKAREEGCNGGKCDEEGWKRGTEGGGKESEQGWPRVLEKL